MSHMSSLATAHQKRHTEERAATSLAPRQETMQRAESASSNEAAVVAMVS